MYFQRVNFLKSVQYTVRIHIAFGNDIKTTTTTTTTTHAMKQQWQRWGKWRRWRRWLLLFWSINMNTRRVPSGSPRKINTISLGRTDALSAHGLFTPYNMRYLVEYPLFARILALCQTCNHTRPTIHDVCMVSLGWSLSPHGANIQAKSLIVSGGKTNAINAHLCGEKSNFPPFLASSGTSFNRCNPILIKESNYRPPNWSVGLYC
jgi:hypothetical protein